VIWQELVEYAVSHNLAGIENLTLILGTVGAAPIQNIGAYGVEAADVIVRVNGFHLEKKEWLTLENKECGLDTGIAFSSVNSGIKYLSLQLF